VELQARPQVPKRVIDTLDIAIHAQEILKIRKSLNNLYASHTGQDLSSIEKFMERDHFMSAQEAVKFGLVDKVISKRDIPKSINTSD
jgi:ATP-dependent Clp protease, protease subunit